ncbi:hypothetical protein [Kitasatospora sp. NPDC057223]|uniref:hypothetical protein n=1 Tax=Kitasatospora sp. NPDC057223 TaxID=3346055 RepID=UPI00362A049F
MDEDGVRPGAVLGAPEVIRTARSLALRGLTGTGTLPSPELRQVAEALVVDEYLAAGGWTDEERRRTVRWVAVLIDRFGEDGVQALLAVAAPAAALVLPRFGAVGEGWKGVPPTGEELPPMSVPGT